MNPDTTNPIIARWNGAKTNIANSMSEMHTHFEKAHDIIKSACGQCFCSKPFVLTLDDDGQYELWAFNDGAFLFVNGKPVPSATQPGYMSKHWSMDISDAERLAAYLGDVNADLIVECWGKCEQHPPILPDELQRYAEYVASKKDQPGESASPMAKLQELLSKGLGAGVEVKIIDIGSSADDDDFDWDPSLGSSPLGATLAGLLLGSIPGDLKDALRKRNSES